jgi:catechol 2,3-dioxygenase-like lactoylglutathione lyase family enzyme
MRARQMDHIVLEVRDVEASLRFYRDLLGMEPVRLEAYRAGGAPFPSVRVGDTLIDLFEAKEPTTGLHHFCIEVAEPVDTILAELDRHALPYTGLGTRFGARGQGQSVYVRDPDGHAVEIRTYTSPSPG